MTEFKFDMGDSTKGDVGYVAYVQANSRADAADKLGEAVGYDLNPLKLHADGVEVLVYFNPARIHVALAEEVSHE